MGTSHDNCTVLGNNFVVICHDMPYNYCFEGSNSKLTFMSVHMYLYVESTFKYFLLFLKKLA